VERVSDEAWLKGNGRSRRKATMEEAEETERRGS